MQTFAEDMRHPVQARFPALYLEPPKPIAAPHVLMQCLWVRCAHISRIRAPDPKASSFAPPSSSDTAGRVCHWVVPHMDFSRGVWWIIEDTGFPKKGVHSVEVARQYCGMLGKQDNF